VTAVDTPFDRLHPAVAHHIVNTLAWPRLRPLQEAAIAPVLDGRHVLLLAPTAGGKTEAAVFPVLSKMLTEDWRGLSVLYVCPLRALLNNLHPRLEHYTNLIGRRTQLWHGDVNQGQRHRILTEPPDLLLTTPESIESMLVSSRVDAEALFRSVRIVVVDEIHAFAGDDRGWHLLAVLERLAHLTGRELQRIGLSATVGNPNGLLQWLTSTSQGAAVVVNPPAQSPAAPDVMLDHVGSLPNAARVISRLHRGEKRLVFVDSRARAEELGFALRQADVETYVSHGSLGRDERHRAEAAFAGANDCAIVATSTLELGIDVGDLDRVIQIDAPATVASFLQRLGRTGRRTGTTRNCLFLATSEDAFLEAAALLHTWGQGWVEPIIAPALPLHLVAQQVLALSLQEHGIGRHSWEDWYGKPFLFGPEAHDHSTEIVDHMLATGVLQDDGGLLSVGAAGEAAFGRRYFAELLSVFTSAPMFTVLHGRTELGVVPDDALLQKDPAKGPRVLLLAGRSWEVTYIDWSRRRVYAEPTDAKGKTRWLGTGQPLSARLCDSARQVLAGNDPTAALTQRATDELAALRERFFWVKEGRTTLERDSDGRLSWWTFAGLRANTTLAHHLTPLRDQTGQRDNLAIALRPTTTLDELKQLISTFGSRPTPVEIAADALDGLKFSACLPVALAKQVLARRLTDADAVRSTSTEPVDQINST
jgi:ATP-dependent Lhr-like helicase